MSMRIEIPTTTPTRSISAVTSMLWEDLVNNPKKEGAGDFINRKKIQCAEKMIRGAFVELYRGLGLLKTYRFLFLLIDARGALQENLFIVSTQKISLNWVLISTPFLAAP